jgi:hypothetical protein
LADFSQNCAIFGQNWAIFGQNWAIFSQIYGHAAPRQSNLGLWEQKKSSKIFRQKLLTQFLR